MNKDTLLQVSEIVSHAGCPDGIGAAMICNAAYASCGMHPPPTNFVQYGTRFHDNLVSRSKQLFVDITPPKGRWEEWMGLDPVVLDHHETMMHVVNSLNGKYGGADHSGAMLAFENVMLPLAGDSMQKQDLESWERLARLCMVRDTWKTASPDWDDACALAHALLLYGQKWGVSAAIAGKVPLDELLPVGAKVHDKIRRQSKGVVKNSPRRNVKIGDASVTVVFFNHANGGTMSDIAHFVMDLMPCNAVVSYFFVYDNEEVQNVASVRTDGCFSARGLAESFGGGGHNNSAGFRIPGEYSPNQIIEMVMERIVTLHSR